MTFNMGENMDEIEKQKQKYTHIGLWDKCDIITDGMPCDLSCKSALKAET